MQHLIGLELIDARVSPADNPTATGIVLEGGLSRPFLVERGWSGPAGYYLECFAISRGAEVAFRSLPRQIFVRGPQTVTRHSDLVEEGVRLEEGAYQLTFYADDVAVDAVAVEARVVRAA